MTAIIEWRRCESTFVGQGGTVHECDAQHGHAGAHREESYREDDEAFVIVEWLDHHAGPTQGAAQ